MKNSIFTLDLLGQFYSSVNTPQQSGVFALVVTLKEMVDPDVLQQAAEDLFQRLPFMNGRLKKSFFAYQFEVQRAAPKVARRGNESLFAPYYLEGRGKLLKVSFDDKQIFFQATHSVCDGRSLAAFARGVLSRYFELQGLTTNNTNVISCDDTMVPEEMEDAVERWIGKPETKANAEDSARDVFTLAGGAANEQAYLSRSYDLAQIKELAAENDLTISAYLVDRIFEVFSEERRAEHATGGITASLQVDCRSFFPSRTLRNFVTDYSLLMSESNNKDVRRSELKKQFQGINKEEVERRLYEFKRIYQLAKYVPRGIKTFAMRRISGVMAGKTTTGLSNLGKFQLAEEVEAQIESLEFPIAIEKGYTTFFSCATVGNVLTMTGTYRAEGRKIVEEVLARIEE